MTSQPIAALPAVVAEHIAAINAFDNDRIVATFAPDAYVNDDLPSASGQAQRSRPADAVGGPGDQCCSKRSSGRTHGVLISVQNGLTSASALPLREGQQRSCRLTSHGGRVTLRS